MDLGGAGLAQHPHHGALGVAADDRVVDDDQPLALDDVVQGVELEPDAELSDRLARLDEGAPDVGVLDQALPEGDARLLGVADGGRGPGLGGRDDQVGLDRVLAGQRAAHLDARLVHRAAVDRRVGAGEVDVLEDAPLAPRGSEALRAQAVLVDGDELAGLDLADEGGADDVEGSGLGGDDPAALEPTDDERAQALRVTGGVEGVLVHEDEAEGALQLGQQLHGRRLEGLVLLVGEQGGDQRGVGRVAAAQLSLRHPPPGAVDLGGRGAVLHHLEELGGVDEVAVVRERDRAGVVATEGGLRVFPRGPAGRRVAAVADGDVPAQCRQAALVEDLGDQPHVLVDEDLLAVARGDARGLLAAVLQGVEAVVGQLGDILARRPDTEDTAGVLGSLFTGEQVVGQGSVSAWHEDQSPTGPTRG